MTRQFQFALVDAFSSVPLAGNPCAVVLGAESLTAGEMLAITREMNQSETAFLMKSQTADFRARYFTPEREIPLAGHPTIASVHVALESGYLQIPPEQTSISIELNEGPIQVKLEKKNELDLIRMYQRKPTFHEIHDPAIVLPLFGLDRDDLLVGAPVQTVSTGTRQLMIPLKSLEALRKIEMNVAAYRAYREKMGFFSPHLFCLGGVSHEGDTFARHPGIAPDTAEDSFTGSATGSMAAFLFKYGLMTKSSFVAEQGHWMGRPGRAYVEVKGTPDQIESVSVAGHAVTTIKGVLSI